MKLTYKVTAIFLILSISLIFSSCSSKSINVNLEQDSDVYVQNEDCQNYLSAFSGFVKVDMGYYFISDSMLFYYDIESKEAYPTCNKANCQHNDSDCTAFLSPMQFYPGMDLYYYDNALYLLGHEDDGPSLQKVYMYQISLDNFKQKKAAFLFDSAGGVSIVCTVHRGYVYFANGSADMEETTAELCRVKLGDLNENAAEKVFEFKGIGADIASLTAYGNNVFFNTSSYSDTRGNDYENILNYMDIHTLKAEQIPERKYSHFADNGRVYYCKDEKTIAYYDLSTKEHKDFCELGGPCYISADSNYIYFDNLQSIIVGNTDEKDRKIFVYDKNGKYITEIVPKNARDDCYFGGDDIMIFKDIVIGETVEADGANGYYVLDKAQLTSDDKQFIDME